MANLADPYQELIDHVSDCTIASKPQAFNLLKSAGCKPASLLSSAQIFNVIDYTNKRYLHIDPLFEKLFGCKDIFSETGLHYFTTLWNKNDLRIFSEKVFPQTIYFLKQLTVYDYPGFSFSFNYRIKTRDGKCYTLLQRETYFSDSADGYPLAALAYIVNITNYKTDSTIIHTVERVNGNFCEVSEVPLFKSVYYPDKTDSVLSKRELEILSAIYEGLGSKEIAERFFVSINTVNNHRKNILQKTNTNNSSELIRYANRNGLL